MHFLLLAAALVTPEAGSSPTPEAILRGIEAYYERHLKTLTPYRAERRYFAEHRLLSKPTFWIVDEDFRAFGHQTFQIRERSGAGVVHRLVFEPLLEVELRSNQPSERPSFDITRRNYSFEFRGWDSERKAWIFDVEPRTQNPYLFRGRIWVDPATFGVFRIEGEPVKDHSAMVRRSRFIHEFELVDGFWLPSKHRSQADLVALGRATFGIDYYNYRMEVTGP